MLHITYKDRSQDKHVGHSVDTFKVVDIIGNVRTGKMVLDRAHQPHQGRPMDLTCHQLETIRMPTWRRNAEAFAQHRDTTAAQRCMMMIDYQGPVRWRHYISLHDECLES